jgi:hypothetical protein
MGNKLFGIHSNIVQENPDKVKGPRALLVILVSDGVYATEAAMVGVPQLADRYVVLGGIKFTKVVGAVAAPMDVAGLDTAVPPEISAVAPVTPVPSSTQVVTKVNTVLPALSAAVVRMNSVSYGATVLLSWNMVVAAAPGVRL